MNGGGVPKPDLTLVLALYQEETILESSVSRIVATLDATRWSWEIVFVEDRSRDRTREILARIMEQRSDPRLRLIQHERNEGRGSAVSDGFRAARGGIVGCVDVDLEVGPEYMVPCVQAIRAGADAAIGRRVFKFTIRGLGRYLMSTGYARIVHALLPRGLATDSEAGYKFFRRDVALSLLNRVHDPGWFWDTEIMARAALAGHRVAEVPCLFERNFSKPSTVKSVRDSFRYLRSLRAFRRRLVREAREREAAAFWRGEGESFARHYEATGPAKGRVKGFLDRREDLLRGWLRVAPGTRALDAGCGHGLTLVALAAQGARVTGLDVSPAMLERARRALESAGHRGATLTLASVESAVLPAASFDLVVAVGLLDYVAEWREALSRLSGWAQPGGRVVFTIPKRPSPFGFLRHGWGLAVRRAVFGLPPIATAVTRRELAEAAAWAGLRIDEVASCQGTMWAVRATRAPNGDGPAEERG